MTPDTQRLIIIQRTR